MKGKLVEKGEQATWTTVFIKQSLFKNVSGRSD